MTDGSRQAPATRSPRPLPRWLKGLNAAAAVTTVRLLVYDPALCCCVPFVAVFLATLSSTVRADGALRVIGTVFTLLFVVVLGVPTVNLWRIAAARRELQPYGGEIYTSGDGMSDVVGPSAVSSVAFRGGLTDDGLRRLRPRLDQFRNFRNLRIENCPVSDEGIEVLAGLDQVRDLDLSGTRVTDRGLRSLARWEKLRRLRLKDTAVTNEGVEELQRANPKLEIQR